MTDLYTPAFEGVTDLTNEEMQLMLVAWQEILLHATTSGEAAIATEALELTKRLVVMVTKYRKRLGLSTVIDAEQCKALVRKANALRSAAEPVVVAVPISTELN